MSFLVAPEAANRLWGDPEPPDATASLLLRSMGYRDALVGGLLLSAALRRSPTAGWFLASAGADAADLMGGIANHSRMDRTQQLKGLGGAAVGMVLLTATAARGAEPPQGSLDAELLRDLDLLGNTNYARDRELGRKLGFG